MPRCLVIQNVRAASSFAGSLTFISVFDLLDRDAERDRELSEKDLPASEYH